MKMRPLYDRVIIKRLAEEQKTAGGIIIPDSAKEKPTKGEVVAVGSGTLTANGELRPLDVKVGDAVLFEKWASNNEVNVNGETLIILKETDIIAVMEA